MNSSNLPRLHLVTDDRVLAEADFVRKAERVIAGGRSAEGSGKFALHLRGPGTSGRSLWEIGRTIAPLCRSAGVPILVNDRLDLALVLGADGAHLGRRSLTPVAARRILGDEVILGASVHTVEEAREVVGQGEVDFLFAGSVFATASHPGRTPIGVKGIEEIVTVSGGLPVLAIGGVDRGQVTAVMAAGAYGVALLSSVWGAEDPGEVVASLLDRIGESLQTSGTSGGGGEGQ